MLLKIYVCFYNMYEYYTTLFYVLTIFQMHFSILYFNYDTWISFGTKNYYKTIHLNKFFLSVCKSVNVVVSHTLEPMLNKSPDNYGYSRYVHTFQVLCNNYRDCIVKGTQLRSLCFLAKLKKASTLVLSLWHHHTWFMLFQFEHNLWGIQDPNLHISKPISWFCICCMVNAISSNCGFFYYIPLQ